MYNIKTLNKISTVGLSRLGSDYTYGDDVQNPDAILVRSASMHEMDMPESLLAIARAGAGVNNIPLDKCSEQGIVVFNTPGANANAVKELVIAGLLLSSRKITAGIEWAKTLKGNGDAVGKMVEKGKSQFAGPEIKGKTLGVIGLGAIGALVANAAIALGMDVIGYDPFLSVDGALQLSRHVKHVTNLDEVFAGSDYITVHVPLTPDTKNIICAENIAKMKDGVRILNYSRADLCNSEDVLAAIESGKVSTYVTDFATDNLLGVDGVITMPHLGASTPESEDNCARMAADEIKDYLENGNITHSVNFPAAKMARTGDVRYCVLHKNVPAVLQSVLSFVSQQGANVENMENKSRKDYAYTIIDVTGASADLTDSIKGVDGVIRVRVIK
ncbi:3-phosphoglycerate dehydrogenase family protein [Oscillospiraceae bacterium LCP25S3_E10]|nr:3-phosphoglycerate dehydrogenase family protein [Ruminococcus sp.]MDD6446751.1 3-phosphoglycerate dehydrogenase family protein [Ruminococcus sp.]MDY2855649.1 3-phosphoglycerate dehydrogenase family protein [Oscillospiraceae bacterium]